MHSRYDERPDPRYSAPRRDDRYAPRNRDIDRERPAAYQSRERYNPYLVQENRRQTDYSENSRRWPSSTQRPSRRYEEPAPIVPRHERRAPPVHQYSPIPLASASYPSRRPDYNDGPPARYERRPQRQEYQAPHPRSYEDDRLPAAYDTRRRLPQNSNGYHPRRESPKPLFAQRAVSPIRGELLPTTMKFLKQRPSDDYPSVRRSPPQYSNSRYESRERYPVRREDHYPRSRGTFKREFEPRRRISSEFEPIPYRSTRGSIRGFRGRTRGRGRGSVARGGIKRADLSPIRAAGEFDDHQEDNGTSDNGDEHERKRRRLRRDTSPEEDKNRSRSLTPSEKFKEVSQNGSNEDHRRSRAEEEEHQDDMLDFDEEVDPVVIERASKIQRRKIQHPDVKDLKLKDVAGD